MNDNNQNNQENMDNPLEGIDPNSKITLSFDQLMQLLNSSGQPINTNFTAPKPEEPKKETNDNRNPGTRVIFQSEDFEREEVRKRFPFQNDDDFDAYDATPVEMSEAKSKKVSMPKVYSGMSVSEKEYSNSDLPGLNANAAQSSRPAIRPPRFNSRFGDDDDDYVNNIHLKRVNVEDIEDENEIKKSEEPDEVNGNLQGFPEDEEETTEEKKAKSKDLVRKVILAIAIVAIICSAGYLAYEGYLKKQNDDFESNVSGMIIDVPTTEKTSKPKKDKNKGETNQALSQYFETIDEQWAKVKSEYPGVNFPLGMQLKYAKLFATNQDFVGYLEAPGSKLSLPIVQNTEEDATNSYLNKNFYSKQTKYGCPFVARNNNVIDLDMNTVIFGHHMNDKTIFGALDAYKTIEGFKAAPIINFNTLYRDYSFKVIAAFITNDDPKDDNGYKFEYSFSNLTETSFAIYLTELSKRAIYDTGVDVLPTDKLLTLSTCSHEFENARFVVVARLIRTGEITVVDTAKAVTNSNPIYPQAYYNKKKMTNPFTDKLQWYGEYVVNQ